jgi:membrane-associated protease RseP (regulator of RpoE activity)
VSADVVRRCGRSVVAIERGGKRVALGTVVGPGGLVVTKSSLIDSDGVTCKLPDGRAVTGKVVHRWPGQDLAAVKVAEADRLPAVEFPAARAEAVGTVVWAPTRAGPTTGIIGHGPRKVGPEPAWAGDGLVGSDRGPLFEGKTPQDRWRFPGLKAGDVIAAVDGRPAASVDDVGRALGRFAESHRAGDPLRLGVLRAGAKADVVLPLPAGRRGWPQPEWESARRSGLDPVATCDLSVRGSDCGVPVFTPGGEFVGVGVASTAPRRAAEMIEHVDKSRRPAVERKPSGAYVVPAAAVRKALAEWGGQKD